MQNKRCGQQLRKTRAARASKAAGTISGRFWAMPPQVARILLIIMIYYDQSILFVHQNLLPNTMDINWLLEISLLLKWSQPRVCPSLVLHEWSQMDPSPMMGTGDSIHVPSWVDLQRIITTTIFHQTKEKPSNDLTRTWNRYGMDYLWVYQKNTLFCIVVFIFRKEVESPHTHGPRSRNHLTSRDSFHLVPRQAFQNLWSKDFW